MNHKYTEHADTSSIRELLMKLADQQLNSDDYGRTLFEIGLHFGEILVKEVRGKSVYLVCTTEDADFLAKGIIDKFNANSVPFAMACYWNVRSKPFANLELSTAPIIKKYEEPDYSKDVLVVLKSIISGGCVVKYNILNIIEKVNPEKIMIVAPVMFHLAESELINDFLPEVSRKFKFITLAIDDDRDEVGNVIPGIGGNVYKRLGFKDQEDKNKNIPKLVSQRRQKYAQA